MNILVTGATGFIGQHMIKRLVKDGHNVLITINKTPSVEYSLKGINIGKENTNTITNFIKGNKIDGIVHLASVFLSSHTPEDIEKLIDSNIKFGTKLLDCAVNAHVKWFINTGTFWQNYQNKNYSPVNLYAATKQAFEDIARYYIETNQIKFCTIRLCDTYGPNDTRAKIFNLWDKIAETGESLSMSPGEQLIDTSYIDDIINAYILLIHHLSAESSFITNGSIFAIKAQKRYSLRELASLFEKTTNKKLNINWGARPYRQREVMKPWDNGIIVPQWESKTSIEEGIKCILHSK